MPAESRPRGSCCWRRGRWPTRGRRPGNSPPTGIFVGLGRSGPALLRLSTAGGIDMPQCTLRGLIRCCRPSGDPRAAAAAGSSPVGEAPSRPPDKPIGLGVQRSGALWRGAYALWGGAAHLFGYYIGAGGKLQPQPQPHRGPGPGPGQPLIAALPVAPPHTHLSNWGAAGRCCRTPTAGPHGGGPYAAVCNTRCEGAQHRHGAQPAG